MLARGIGQEFLWVDALCVIQDDERDEMNEIARMCSIFRHAYLTVAAADGAEANSGLPGINNSTPWRVFQLTGQYLPGRHLVTVQPDISQMLANTKWNSRGWTLQERNFSLRTLIVSDKGAYLRCRRTVWCETVVAEEENATRFFQVNEVSDYSFSAESKEVPMSNFARMNQTSRSQMWPDLRAYGTLLKDYSCRDLSYSTDVLNAFAGITQGLSRSWWVGFFGAFLSCSLALPYYGNILGLDDVPQAVASNSPVGHGSDGRNLVSSCMT